jgi:4-hydroxythreonine-4-phosphate dehydrogenase
LESSTPLRSGGPIRLAVTLGDPRGIGPEVVSASARRFLEGRTDVELLLLGDRQNLGERAQGLPYEAVCGFDGSQESAGEVALRAVQRGVELALAGEVHGLVTGPVHKPSLQAAGAYYPGHTELLADLTGAREVGMLMHADPTRFGGPLRILLATTHLALRDVPGRITRELVEGQVGLLHESLVRWWGLSSPRIALCALNPHASDGGLFGDEEAKIMEPAAASLRARGIDVTDPLPADTVFLRATGGQADAVVVPYHDVGMAVFKTLSFGRGVNVTLGLPFPRTSPDHGTAFDLAGTGLADPSSTLEALQLAVRLSAVARLPAAARSAVSEAQTL